MLLDKVGKMNLIIRGFLKACLNMFKSWTYLLKTLADNISFSVIRFCLPPPPPFPFVLVGFFLTEVNIEIILLDSA